MRYLQFHQFIGTYSFAAEMAYLYIPELELTPRDAG